MQKFFLLFLFLIMNCLNVGLSLASNADDVPEASANGYFKALRENKIDQFADYMHPEALDQFKNILSAVANLAKEKKSEKQFLSFFYNITSSDQLSKLSSKDFFVAFYQGLIAQNPLITQTLQGAVVVPLGHVKDGEDLAHVVYRITMKLENVETQKISVITLKRYQTTWRVLLTSDIETLASNLKQIFADK